MASNIQSNPVYYSLSSLSSGQNLSTRTVVLHRRSDHAGFGVYIGEDVPAGLYIVTVERNSPASDANLQPGDRVLAVNGQLVSMMKDNPRETLIREANNAPNLTLTIQSTDIYQNLINPLGTSSRANNDQSNYHQYPTRQTFTTSNMNLESYVKSLFANEDVEILPSSKRNEFILSTKLHPKYPEDYNFLSTQSHNLREHKKKNRSQRPRHRNHRSKPVLVESKETQTSIDKDSHENFPPQLSFPKLNKDTSQLVLQVQQNFPDNSQHTRQNNHYPAVDPTLSSSPVRLSSSSDDQSPITTPTKLSTNSKTKSTPMTHMADVVTAVLDNKHQTRQANRLVGTTTRDSAPSASYPLTNESSRESAIITNPTLVPSQQQRIPPPEGSSRDPVVDTNRAVVSSQQQRIPPSDSSAREPAIITNPTLVSSQQQRIPPSEDSSRDPAAITNRAAVSSQQQRIPPSDSSSRDPVVVTNRAAVASSTSQEPPPYASPINASTSSRPTDNQPGNSQNPRNVRIIEPNQKELPSTRPESTREIHLTRMEDFNGFGFHLQYNKHYYLIQRIEPDSPSQRAGLCPNDVILSINGDKTDDMPHSHFVEVVSSSQSVTFVVQSLEDYLHIHPARARNQPVATAIAAAAAITSSDEPVKQRSGVSKALSKLTNR